MTSEWSDPTLFFDGDSYFADLLLALNRAQRSIWIEVYIYESDRLGTRISEVLVAAAKRGVKVQLLIDAVGCFYSSASLEQAFLGSGVSLSVYNSLPFARLVSTSTAQHTRPTLFRDSLRHLFRRNHRKIVIVDEEVAWIGGMNFSEVHCAEFLGENAWRDTSLRVRGPGVASILAAASLLWHPVFSPSRTAARKQIRESLRRSKSPALLLNSSLALRRRKNRVLFNKVRSAKKRILVTTAYFIPTRRMRSALKSAARRGVDVRVLVPQRADVLFMPWAAHVFFASLLEGGVRVFEFLPRMLHAKCLIIDDWGTVGTSNLNHRSFHQDLEIDLVVTDNATLSRMSQQFALDLESSQEITEASLSKRPLWQRLLGRLALLFKSQL
jgi:cardiolipin synthase